ncbi:MAG: hypothetical protein WC788_01140 [Candidatus Paceibacterota bacterium]
MNKTNHRVPFKIEIAAEEYNPRLQKAMDMANRPTKVGIEAWNFMGPVFSLKP